MKRHKLLNSIINSTDELWEINHAQYGIRKLTVDVDAPYLVFLHDALGSIEQWKTFPELLVSKLGYNAILIDRQGHGRSSSFTDKRGIDYLEKEAFGVLPVLLKHAGIKKPVLVGHSDGATIALLYGAKHAAHSIISMAPHIFIEQITLGSIAKSRLNKHAIVAKLVKYHGEKATTLFDYWAETWLTEAFSQFNVTHYIKDIPAPIFAIQSLDDGYGTIKQIDTIIEHSPSSNTEKLLFNEGGHLLHVTNPEVLASAITEFILKTI